MASFQGHVIDINGPFAVQLYPSSFGFVVVGGGFYFPFLL